MGRKKRLDVVRSKVQYANGDRDSSEHSLPQVEPVLESQALEAGKIQVEQQDGDLLNLSGTTVVRQSKN